MFNERMAYSPMEVASMLGLCLNSVYKMLKRGQLKGVRVGRKILIPKSELGRLLSESNPPPAGTSRAVGPVDYTVIKGAGYEQ